MSRLGSNQLKLTLENGFFRLCIFLTATSVDRVFRLFQLSGYLVFEDLAARLAFGAGLRSAITVSPAMVLWPG